MRAVMRACAAGVADVHLRMAPTLATTRGGKGARPRTTRRLCDCERTRRVWSCVEDQSSTSCGSVFEKVSLACFLVR